MSWASYHAQSEHYANLAEAAVRQGDLDHAYEYYRLAAEQEISALGQLAPSKTRTLGITFVSAASLWFKARDFRQTQTIAYRGLANGSLPTFAVEELQNLLQASWNEEVREKSGVKFTEGEVLISVSGGEVVAGGAPLDLILRKVDEVSRIFYRTIEMLLNAPFRKRGAPSQDIQEQFRPWLFQAPAGSYQFAVRVERPKQLSLFPDFAPSVDQITKKFLEIVRLSADDPQGEMVTAVPDQQYRETFLKLTRNLAPTGKVFGKMEIRASGDIPSRSIVLMPVARDVINQTLRSTLPRSTKDEEQKEVQLSGTLRGLQLDNDWIEIVSDDQKTIRVYEAGDAIDDVVGPMVNHKVVVSVIQRPSGRYAFRDVQPEE